MTDPRKVEYKKLSDLTADPRNPKSHDEDIIDQSIGRFGVLDLIVQDQRTGFIVSGHGRHKVLTAMQERGESAPEGVKTDAEGNWLVPVVTGWASRTDAEAGAALIALNRTTELGGWADKELLDLLDELSEIEDGLIGVGFTEEDREALEHLTYEASDEAPVRNLDDLYEIVGDPTPADALQKVVLTLTSNTAERLREYVGSEPEDQESSIAEMLAHVGA